MGRQELSAGFPSQAGSSEHPEVGPTLRPSPHSSSPSLPGPCPIQPPPQLPSALTPLALATQPVPILEGAPSLRPDSFSPS